MNKTELAQAAKELESRFGDPVPLSQRVAGLYNDLKPYIEKAKKGELDTPMEKSSVPGGYLFNDGELRPYPDLERAYVHFRVQISGGLSKKQEKILKQIGKM